MVGLRTIAAFGAVVLSVTSASAAPAVGLAPIAGPPSSAVTVTGTGFGANAGIDVFFDTTDLCLAVADSLGNASCAIRVPRDSQPRSHWITMLQRSSGTGAQKPFAVRTDWAQYHGRTAAHSGYNPFENTLNTGNVASLDILWQARVGGGTTSQPAIWGSNVYIGSGDGHLYAFNATTGATVAGFPRTLGGPVVNSSPVIGGGNVYVGTFSPDNKLYGFNAATGAPLANFPLQLGDSVQSPPAYALGNVYVGSDDAKLYAFNGITGAAVSGFPKALTGPVFGSPTIVSGHVYAGDNAAPGILYGFDALNGGTLPNFPHSTFVSIFSTPVVSNGVILSGTEGFVQGYSVSTGLATPRFTFDATVNSIGYTVQPDLSVAGGNIFVPLSAGGIADFVAGNPPFLSWFTNIADNLVTQVTGTTEVANGVLYTIGIDEVVALDAQSGSVLWRTAIGEPSIYPRSLAVTNGIVYAGSTDGNLYAFSVNGLPPTARLPGGEAGVRPALSALKPDYTLKPTASAAGAVVPASEDQ